MLKTFSFVSRMKMLCVFFCSFDYITCGTILFCVVLMNVFLNSDEVKQLEIAYLELVG